MIQSKEDYLEYLMEDKRAINNPKRNTITWKYLKALRRAEYYTNVRGGIWLSLQG